MRLPELGFLSRTFDLLSSHPPPVWASLIAGFFVVVSLSLSVYLIFEHLSAYNNPEEQKFLLGVIMMVPCYAIESYVSLVNPSLSVDCGILRDCYEAFAMYCFGRYLTACLGGEERTIEFLKREGTFGFNAPLLESSSARGVVHHHFPMNYLLKPWILGQSFYETIRFGVFQYMIIKTLTSTLSVILEAFDVYCDGEFNWGCGYPYFAVVLNFSQYWALYCLVAFYTATKDELAPIQPLFKFLTFKSIVFLTWWQGVLIALLDTLGLLRSPIAQGLQFRSSIQDFIICIEMGVASLVHLYVFPAKPYEVMNAHFPGKVSVLGDYVAFDYPVDPDEVREVSRPSKLKLPQPKPDEKSATNIKDSVRDFVLGSGEYVIKDFKFTMNQAVEPVEKGLSIFNKRLHKISRNITKSHKDAVSRDDSNIYLSSPAPIRGIDDPLLGGSASDSGLVKARRQRKGRSTTGEGLEERDDNSNDGFKIHGHRWQTRS